jgi:hypothetical protein
MEYIDIIRAQINITSIIESLKFTINEIKEKNPKRKDFINGMEKHIIQMNEVYLTFKELNKEYELLSKMNFNYHKENMEFRFEIEKLKEQNAHLINGI